MWYCIVGMSFTTVILCSLGDPGAKQHFNKQTCAGRLQEAEYLSGGSCLMPHHAQGISSVERGCV